MLNSVLTSKLDRIVKRNQSAPFSLVPNTSVFIEGEDRLEEQELERLHRIPDKPRHQIHRQACCSVVDVKEDELDKLYEKQNRKAALWKENEERVGFEVDHVDGLPIKTLDGELRYRTGDQLLEPQPQIEFILRSQFLKIWPWKKKLVNMMIIMV
ncbi:hypothetical protein J5N97_027561 [Dioscorea zingiberensis]|uniref:Uncharacterized protein n=1 Tax=Dioscorea zingiberensis TaxID=325984 RepID=A0A9D5H7T2_9LILI|nr:hypothetical protein J5N97_027561 [Dioscorea zingiberensis]